VAKKGSKSVSQKFIAAGEKNLLDYREKNPTPALKHGAYSHAIRRRYGDKRYREGKQLAEIMSALIEDLGGNDKITASQRLILDNIKAKVIVICQISKYVDRQPSIINEKGELLPCLGRNYTTYSEALRRDLEALTAMTSKKKASSYKDIMKELEGDQSG
jgi:hypothetical protein